MADIYDEVLADKKKLLEVAESNAKNKLIDVVTPRIKELVESALLGKLNEFADGDDMLGGIDIDIDPVGDPMGGSMPPADPMATPGTMPIDASGPPVQQQGGVAAGENAAVSLPDAQGKVTLDIDALTNTGGSSVVDAQFELTPESIQALDALVSGHVADINLIETRAARMLKATKRLAVSGSTSFKDQERARQIKLECERLYADLQAIRESIDVGRANKAEAKLERAFHGIMEHYSSVGHVTAIVQETVSINRRAAKLNKVLKESRSLTAEDVHQAAQMMREVLDLHTICGGLLETLDGSIDVMSVRQVVANLATLYTEIRKMATKKGKINEAGDMDVAGADMAGDDMAGIDDMGAAPEGDVDGEAVLVQLKLPASLSDLVPGASVEVAGVEPAEDVAGEMGDGDGDLDDMGLDAMGDEDMGAEDMGDEEVEEESYDEGHSMHEAKLNDDDIIEIDEAALVQEMKNMKKLRETGRLAKGPTNPDRSKQGGHGPAHFDAFGGGHEDGEKFIDGEDLNAHDPVGSEGFLDEGYEDDLDEGDDDDLDEGDSEDLDERHEDDDLDEGDEEDLDEAEDEALDEDYGYSGSGYSQWTKGNAPGAAAMQKRGHGGKKGRRGKKAESRRPMNGKQLAEAFQKVRAELAGQKLFNTKLVALNKVLQIPGLKQAQKERVVEILEKGRTVAEVGQLYSKIVEQLQKGAAKQIKESAGATQGGASKPTLSSGPSKTDEANPIIERWNKIAFGTNGGVIQG